MPRNHRVAGSPERLLYLCTLLPLLALTIGIPAIGVGLAQDTAGGAKVSEPAARLRLKSVITPETIIVDPSSARDTKTVETGAEADSPAGEAGMATPRTFRIGVVPRGETGAFLRALAPFRAGIAETLGRPAEILAFSNFTAMIDAQVLRRIDLGFYSASAYALADKVCDCLDPLVAPAAADGSMVFHGIIVARRRSGIASIADLEGRDIAAGAPDSVGSRRIQLAELSAGGIDVGSYFSNITTARNALDALLMVRDEQVDAAFSWSSLTGNAAAGYSRGPLAFLVKRGELSMDEIAIIWRSRPIAHAPAAVAKSLPGDVRQALAGYFIHLADNDPETYDILDRDYGGGYRAVKRRDYDGALVLASKDVTIQESQPALPVPRIRPRPTGGDGQGAN